MTTLDFSHPSGQYYRSFLALESNGCLAKIIRYLNLDYLSLKFKKSKAVPWHTMKICRENGGLAPFILNLGSIGR
jgi:hypothetical protein